jgi:hypothetical protein
MNATKKLLLPLIVMLALLIAGAFALPANAQAPVVNQITVPVYSAVGVTTGTVNTSSPNVDQYGRDVSAAAMYESVDIFFTSDISGTGYVTATAQVSADGVNWANATQDYWTGSAIATSTHARSLSADGSTYMSVPLAGEYWRVSIQTTGTATNTVKATLHKEAD